jgi:hypothetical protein
MGLLCDYFVAADDAAAAATIDIAGGPGGKIPLPMSFAQLVAKYGHEGARAFLAPKVRLSVHGFQVVSTKNFAPFTELATVEAALTGEDWNEVLRRSPEPVAMRDEGECVVLPLGEPTCAALIGAAETALSEAALAVVRDATPPGREPGDSSPIVELLGQLRELARGAAEREEQVYCWVCV